MNSKTTFGKIQTNRVTLKRYMEQFKNNKEGDESFISPRPKPGTQQAQYIALLKFPRESKNSKLFTAQKNFRELTEAEYKSELDSFQFSWEA